jgi:carbamate kinase
MSVRGPFVLAFGGNALLPDPFQPEGQERRAAELARSVRLLLARAAGLVLVHGNGPQVGMILLRVEGTRERLPPEPLDVLVSETQGSIGYLLSRALRNALRSEEAAVGVTTILTQVEVDPADPAFLRPTKPIGPPYSDEAAELLRQRGWHMVREVGRGWRRVVPSPRPLSVVELAAIRAAAGPGQVVIAGGGGGVPVCVDGARGHVGVEAVIDKDRTAALLAQALKAEGFVILTGVARVVEGFGGARPRPLARVRAAHMRALLAAGEFPPGSMGPKVEAACDYVERSGRPALITDAAHLESALRGEDGTWIEA